MNATTRTSSSLLAGLVVWQSRTRARQGAAAESRGRYRLWRGTFAEAATPKHQCHRLMPSARRSEHVVTWTLTPAHYAYTSRDACAGRTPGTNLCVPLLGSPMDSHHETGTVTLSGVRGVLPSTWPAGAHAWASARVHTSSESRMSQGVGRCHVDSPPRRETSLWTHQHASSGVCSYLYCYGSISI